MTNVIIAGGRDFADEDLLFKKASALAKSLYGMTVICGGARGADTLGAKWAQHYGLEVTYMPADWKAHGKAAGPIRNRAMAEIGDVLLAFWDGKSTGTKSMINLALQKGLEVHVYNVG